jgi:hypothetical protein
VRVPAVRAVSEAVPLVACPPSPPRSPAFPPVATLVSDTSLLIAAWLAGRSAISDATGQDRSTGPGGKNVHAARIDDRAIAQRDHRFRALHCAALAGQRVTALPARSDRRVARDIKHRILHRHPEVPGLGRAAGAEIGRSGKPALGLRQEVEMTGHGNRGIFKIERSRDTPGVAAIEPRAADRQARDVQITENVECGANRADIHPAAKGIAAVAKPIARPVSALELERDLVECDLDRRLESVEIDMPVRSIAAARAFGERQRRAARPGRL